MKEKIYLQALKLAPGLGDILIKQLVSYCGSVEAVFNATSAKLKSIPGIGTKVLQSVKSAKSHITQAEEQIEKIVENGADVYCYTEASYPSRLKEVNDGPVLLYYKGTCNLNNVRVIAIVGTRNATEYGKQAVEEIVSGIIEHKPLIVSGLAYGIDVHAHKQALTHGLDTVGVMASGIDIIYPGIHTKIAGQMVENGGLITEYVAGTKPDAPHFPSRNRIIAGMSDAVVVVEAAVRGGALITAELANGYNRDVFAVPGSLHTKFSEGCNKLIRNHKANILTDPKDIEYFLGWPESGKDELPKPDLSKLNNEERSIIELLDTFPEGLKIDELSWKSQIPINRLASILLNLEFSGLIVSLPGKKYKVK